MDANMRISRVIFCIATIAVIATQPRAWGQSPQGLPPINLGFTSFLDGAPPAGPGLYFSQYTAYYTANQFKGNEGVTLPLPNPDLSVGISLTQFIYMWKSNLQIGEMELPAKPALDVLIPLIGTDLNFSGPVPLFDGGGGFGDLLIGPALQFDPIMGENGPRFVHRLEAQFMLPTGEYNRFSVVNPGSNFFSFNPYWAGTAFITPKDTISFRAHYLWNATNDEPNPFITPIGTTSTKAGDAFHINFAAEHEVIEKMLRVGVNGYWLAQTTDAQVNGVDVNGSREQVLGIGPGAILSFSQTKHVFCNIYWETDVENRPDGFKLNLRYVQKF